MFINRFDAGHQLAERLTAYANNPNAIILAIPRGGLELGYVLAKELHLPLNIVLTKKIGYPGNPEFALGAVSADHVYIDDRFKDVAELQTYIAHQVQEIRELLHERALRYRQGKEPLSIKDKIVIVVDDGVATGSTLTATLMLIKQEDPKKIIVALPVAPPEALKRLQLHADELICVKVPDLFFGVGQFYQNFSQVDDEEAIRLLHEANQ